LLAASGEENRAIAAGLGIVTNTVLKWRKWFFEEGLDGLVDRSRSGRPKIFSPSGAGRGQSDRLRVASQAGRAAQPLLGR
jgi:hypothetical protein